MARIKRKPMSDINVVPYIDVMLVLLVIFMVTAPMMTQGVKVDLPKISSTPVELKKDQVPVIVSIDINGAYYLEVGKDRSKPLSLSSLTTKVGKILKANPAAKILVKGDKHVEYGSVVVLMSRLNRVGATSVGLITENP
jgi:biopolymer transport protein TolR